MPDDSFLNWPFFESHHREWARALDTWAAHELHDIGHEGDVEATCRDLVARLAAGGWLEACVGPPLDVRTLCLSREILARRHGLADFAFAMQGLGSGAVSLFGDEAQREAVLPAVQAGDAVAAFALSEPEAGSDVSALATTAVRDGEDYVLDGTKTWISNGPIADVFTVFARTGEGPGAKGLSAFIVEAATPGVDASERIDVIAPHPLATVRFDGCHVPAANLLGHAGEGFKIAMATLDVFRSTVGAAALGFARAALDLALERAGGRMMFGAPLFDLQMTQASIADMALKVDAAALLVYRAAWTKDVQARRITREASMAKLYATEAAQQVIDAAVQLHGGHGVVSGHPAERLYREIRALRIYEGASEVHKVIIARQAMAAFNETQKKGGETP